MRRSTERGDRAGANPLGDVLGGERRHRGDQALAEQEDRGALADPIADRPDRLRKGGGGNRQADQVDARELDLGGALDGEGVGERHSREVALVGSRLAHLLGALGVLVPS